jgi:hypothetical protein
MTTATENQPILAETPVTDAEAKEHLKAALARPGIRVDPKTVNPGKQYRVNFYKEEKDSEHVLTSWKMVDSKFMDVIRTSVGLECIERN